MSKLLYFVYQNGHPMLRGEVDVELNDEDMSHIADYFSDSENSLSNTIPWSWLSEPTTEEISMDMGEQPEYDDVDWDGEVTVEVQLSDDVMTKVRPET